MGIYDDMLSLKRPASAHPRMPREERAKQFMPFASLRGFGDEISERGRERTERRIPDEDEDRIKSAREKELAQKISAHPDVRVLLFVPALPGGTRGEYRVVKGRAARYDPVEHTVYLSGERVDLKDAVSIEFEQDDTEEQDGS